MAKSGKSIFEKSLLSTKVKSANVKIFPEGGLGYFIGPTLALLANSVLAGYLNKYMTDVLDINNWGAWGKMFMTLLPVVSVILVVLGNIVVGRLMDRNKTKAGKARPLLLLAIPLGILALLVTFVFTPFANADSSASKQMTAAILLAMGYNLWFAVAYPFYYTSHSALVNLSTRNSKDRSLLATISNATALAAMGLCSMILPFFLGNLFVYDMSPTAADSFPVLSEAGKILYYTHGEGGAIIYDQLSSYNHWKIFIIAILVLNVIGIIVEYYFTRERITEESFTSSESDKKPAARISEQARVCFKDKYWWIIIVFFFLYQLGGMVKNVSQIYYCQEMFHDANGNYSNAIGGTYSGTMSIVGAIPTALGMFIAWPLANKVGKGRSILFGSILSVIGGAIGFIAPTNFTVVVASFVLKALGSTPAMYLSLALLADVLDHQEAVHEVRTDGLTMTIYGAIMAGMTGIATGILNGVLGLVGYDPNAAPTELIQTAMPWLFIGAETLCYVAIVILFIFMGVEKFGSIDKRAIKQNRMAKAEADGVEYIDPMETLEREEREAAEQSEKARIAELRSRCEKKGLDFEKEEAEYQKRLEIKRVAAEAKKAAADKKREERLAEKQRKYDMLDDEQKAKLEAKKEAKAAKLEAKEAKTLAEFNAVRTKYGKPAIE